MKDKQMEKAALTYGMFVMCEAAEMLLDKIIGETCPTPEGLKHEARMYYNRMIDGIKKAKSGYSGFNERVQSLYSEMGATGEQMDKIRRDANHMVRMFCHSRNMIDDKAKSLNADEVLSKAYDHETAIISEETISKFTMK